MYSWEGGHEGTDRQLIKVPRWSPRCRVRKIQHSLEIFVKCTTHKTAADCNMSNRSTSQAALVAVLQLHVSRPPGDVLVFLCGPVFHCASIFWHYYEHILNYYIWYSNKIIYNYTTLIVVSAWIYFHFCLRCCKFYNEAGSRRYWQFAEAIGGEAGAIDMSWQQFGVKAHRPTLHPEDMLAKERQWTCVLSCPFQFE